MILEGKVSCFILNACFKHITLSEKIIDYQNMYIEVAISFRFDVRILKYLQSDFACGLFFSLTFFRY